MDRTKSEVLRYLGHRRQEIPEELHKLIDDCLALMRAAALPRHVRMTFDILPGGSGLFLAGTGLCLRGNDIARHLRDCAQAVMLAATLGAGADSIILKWEHTDLTRSLILDACATQLIEEYCEKIGLGIRAEAAGSGLMTTPRFSPGYGDFPLDIQPQILGALDAGRRIGLTCTQSLIMLPRKSVTALVGLGKSPTLPSAGGCANCGMSDTCGFRKDGNAYGCPGVVKE